MIRHKWCNEDGEEQVDRSAVEGSTEWFNAQYDDGDDVLTLNVDIENGDLDIMS